MVIISKICTIAVAVVVVAVVGNVVNGDDIARGMIIKNLFGITVAVAIVTIGTQNVLCCHFC